MRRRRKAPSAAGFFTHLSARTWARRSRALEPVEKTTRRSVLTAKLYTHVADPTVGAAVDKIDEALGTRTGTQLRNSACTNGIHRPRPSSGRQLQRADEVFDGSTEIERFVLHNPMSCTAKERSTNARPLHRRLGRCRESPSIAVQGWYRRRPQSFQESFRGRKRNELSRHPMKSLRVTRAECTCVPWPLSFDERNEPGIEVRSIYGLSTKRAIVGPEVALDVDHSQQPFLLRSCCVTGLPIVFSISERSPPPRPLSLPVLSVMALFGSGHWL